ncbi:hypothetical protein ACFE04_020579 [Oxalis oulophora]
MASSSSNLIITTSALFKASDHNNPKESLKIKIPSLPINYGKWSITNHSTFISTLYPNSKGNIHNEYEKRLNSFKHMLTKVGQSTQALTMIDVVQRLGIDHYFQEEIENILRFHFGVFSSYDQDLDHHLHEVSLRFRLLRQQGHRVSAARLVKIVLDHPYRKSLVTSMEGNFVIDNNGGAARWMNVVQELSKLDVVRSLHQDEIIQVSKWWKDVGLANELTFARDEPLKWYIWSTVCFKDSTLSKQRVNLTKAISFIYLIDDIFDVHGTLDELILFTQALNRWDYTSIEGLPHYFKVCFKALDDITNEISYTIFKDYGTNPTNALRKTWATLCDAFLVEAKWFASGHVPNSEEYLKNGIISSGVHVVLVHAFFLLGHNDMTIIDNNPAIISSTATILRLWDDFGSSQDEDQDGYDGSYIECYMKENIGTSKEDAAKSRVTHMIRDAWKQLNKECLSPNPFSTKFIEASLNLARMVPLMYSYDDKHHLPNLDKYINSNVF